MKKTCISTLLVVLLAGAQMVRAEESMDDVFAQLDAANNAGGQPVEAVAVAPAATAQVDDVAPAAVESADNAAPQDSGTAVAASQSDMADRLLDKGIDLYRKGKFDEALTVFDTVIALDKFNDRAVAYKKRTSQRILSKEGAKKATTRALALAEVQEAWSPTPKALASVDTPKNAAEEANEAAVRRMEARLKSINIPLLDFQNTSIQDIMLFLSAGSRSADPTGKGVNILLLGMDSAENVNLSLSITDISLYDALRLVAGMSSFKLEIKPNAVAVMPAGFVPASEMVTKSYKVVPEVGEELQAAAGGSDAGAEDLFGDSTSSASSDTEPADVAGFFSVIDFPKGAVATYQPRFHKLYVKNTPRNIEGIESILADLEEKAALARSQQVEIEAKFVEFNEGALEELGFDWNIYGGGKVAGFQMDPRNAAGGTDSNTGVPILKNGIGSGTTADGRPGQSLLGVLRDSTKAFLPGASGLAGLLGGTPSTMMVGNGDVDLMIKAMQHDGSADVLSAPKVTTKSGSEAIIRVAETHRYPQDFDVETGQRTSPVVKPQDWADFDLGVTLKVTPEVNAENNTIDLSLHPESMKFLGFEKYKVGSNGYGAPKNPPTAWDPTLDRTLFAKMPYFRRRSVETQVTIADGSTVVMGGLVDETTETFRDQVPILGDIPYLGRLFRSEGTRSVKKNLVIYVTAKQVDASGMSVAERRLVRAGGNGTGAL